MPIIHTEQLRRVFHHKTRDEKTRKKTTTELVAVNDLSITVEAGESIGYIGANGAGKSTTIKMLLGILRPTSGSVTTHGVDPMARRVDIAKKTGVVFGQRSALWWDLPLRESFLILGDVFRLDSAVRDERTAALTDTLSLGAFLDKPVRQLSLGQRMRGELAAALLHSPSLVVLDEPTIGLDVLSKQYLREFLLTEQKEHGTTLFLTTHDMGDVAQLCGRIVVVNEGAAVFDGTLSELTRVVGKERIVKVSCQQDNAADLLGDISGARLVPQETTGDESGEGKPGDGRHVELHFDPDAVAIDHILRSVLDRVDVVDLSTAEPDPEETMRDLYRKLDANGGEVHA